MIHQAHFDEIRRENERLRAQLGEVRALANEHWDWKAGQVLSRRLRAIVGPAEAEPTPRTQEEKVTFRKAWDEHYDRSRQ